MTFVPKSQQFYSTAIIVISNFSLSSFFYLYIQQRRQFLAYRHLSILIIHCSFKAINTQRLCFIFSRLARIPVTQFFFPTSSASVCVHMYVPFICCKEKVYFISNYIYYSIPTFNAAVQKYGSILPYLSGYTLNPNSFVLERFCFS